MSKYLEEFKNYKSGREIMTKKNNSNNKRCITSYNINDKNYDSNNNNLYCISLGNSPTEYSSYSNLNLNLKDRSKMIYFKNKLKKDIKNINTHSINNYRKNLILRQNTIDYNDDNTYKKNRGTIDSNYNNYYNYIYNNSLKTNKTGLIINNNFEKKIIFKDNNKNNLKNKNKSLTNLQINNKLFLSPEKSHEFLNIINRNKNIQKKQKSIYKIIKKKEIKSKRLEKENIINKSTNFYNKQNNIDYKNILDEDYFRNNNEKEEENNIYNNDKDKNDETMSKELFSLLVKKLNNALEENEQEKRKLNILTKENIKLKQIINLDKTNNEIILKEKTKEINELKKDKEVLKKENEKLKLEILKMKMIKRKKHSSNANNRIKQVDDHDLNQLDSICSLIGGSNGYSNYSTEKELIYVNKNKNL
jgi:hypothetical protein